MSHFIDAGISDKRYIRPGHEYRRIDSTGEVNKGGLENRLQYEYVARRTSSSYDLFLKDYLPDGKVDDKYSFYTPQWGGEKCQVYVWGGYIICISVNSLNLTGHNQFAGRDFSTGSDYFGQWVNVEAGVYGDNLLELFIYHSQSHPRDAHKILARKYEWDLSPDSIFLHNQKFGYRQSLTMPSDFDFKQEVKFVEELGWTVHQVCKYQNRTGTALRGAIVYCQSPDQTRMISIPVVQYERISDNGQEVIYPGITKAPAETYTASPAMQYHLHVCPPRPVFQADTSFFQAPYPLFNEDALEKKRDATVIITQDEPQALHLNSHLDKSTEYVGISWPGGKNTVKDVDWWSLEGRKIGFLVGHADIKTCRFAYNIYKAVTKIAPQEFNFHVLKNSLPDSIESSDSIAKNYRRLTPDEFVKYVWEVFHIALEADLQPALSALTVDEFMAQDIGEPDYALAPVLPCPGTAEIFAPRGLGKTFFALELAKAIAAGGSAFGRYTSSIPRDVLYIDGEMSIQSMAKRIKLLGLSQAGDKLKIMSAATLGHPIKDLSTPEGQTDVERYLKKNKTEVIFIDNLATLAPRSLGNDAECCIPLNTWVQDLKYRGYTVVLIHHAGKGNSGRGGSQRGSSTKEDMLDLVISLEVPKQKRNQAHFDVVFTKGRDLYGEEIEPFSLTLTTVKSANEESVSAHWEVYEKSNSKAASELRPNATVRPTRPSEDNQRLLQEIENLYRTTGDNEDIIAEQVGLENRGRLNRFLDKFPNDKKRIKSIRPSTRSANKWAVPSATIESEPISAFPN